MPLVVPSYAKDLLWPPDWRVDLGGHGNFNSLQGPRVFERIEHLLKGLRSEKIRFNHKLQKRQARALPLTVEALIDFPSLREVIRGTKKFQAYLNDTFFRVKRKRSQVDSPFGWSRLGVQARIDHRQVRLGGHALKFGETGHSVE